MHVFVQIGLVALGSAVGGVSRWAVGLAIARWLGTAFPWGTLLINVTGCLFLGWFSTWSSDRLLGGIGWLNADGLKLLVAVGFTGGYTTFSTFEFEASGLLKQGNSLFGLSYLVASVFLGLVAVYLGVRLAKL